MKPLQIKHEHPLFSTDGARYTGFTFDGYYFYITCASEHKILKYDQEFCEVAQIKTEKQYTCLCYNPKEHCFWGGRNTQPNTLFQLNLNFQEISHIQIYPCDEESMLITGVSYDCNKESLVVTFPHYTVMVNPCNPDDFTILQNSYHLENKSVLSVSPSRVTTVIKNTEQYLNIYGYDNTMKHQLCIPNQYEIDALLFYPFDANCSGGHTFYFLARKRNCNSCILACTLEECDFQISPCNFCVCELHCCETKQDCTQNDPRDEVLESIALVETSLAHLLNTEAEKLQKIMAHTEDIHTILCANQSVEKMLTRVTHLEIILYDKLTAAMEQKTCDTNNCHSGWENDCDCAHDCHKNIRSKNNISDQNQLQRNPLDLLNSMMNIKENDPLSHLF